MDLQPIKDALASATPAPWVVGDDPSQVIAPCPCCGLIATCAPYGIPTGDRDYDLRHHYNSGLIANSPMWLAALTSDPAIYKRHNPENGWGSYDRFVPWLTDYLEACQANPAATIRVSR